MTPSSRKPLPPVTPEMRRKLRFVRLFRQWAIWGSTVPWLIVGLLVLVHRLSGRVFGPWLLAQEPWTFRFFTTLFSLWFLALIVLFLNRGIRCPRCGLGFRTRMDHEANWGRMNDAPGFGANVFSRRCLNCGLREDGTG